ncbi:uncharacterized protein LOC131619733 [Vicia villosa]|uniref:uncharacterized protein LOC131619733 n=1 Tax=Vicia villosa TaxID=3911 RepID=UPI00273C6C5E|nr:uncharacterized protein LOC131619733 [Vicia villosa]
MILGTLNIRGGGSRIKRKRISGIINKRGADMFLIHETKMEDVPEAIAMSFWRSEDVNFSFMPSEGLSDGILTLWNTNTVNVLFSFRGLGFLGTKVKWKRSLYYVVNIYSPCSLALKRIMWNKLIYLKRSYTDGEWIIGGDFNAVKRREERFGRSVDSSNVERRKFMEFIDDCDLVDVPCKGKKYSWYRGDGQSESRIDRFLVSEDIINSWGIVGQFIDKRGISDHCPMWLESDKEDWGPKLLKFNNKWLSNKDFIPFIEKEWKEMKVRGRGDFVLKEKIRLLKERLRWWNKSVFGKYDLEVEEGVREMNELGEIDVADAESLANNRKASKRIWLNLKIKENMLIQKSRLRWLNDGDSNSKFFHRIMK